MRSEKLKRHKNNISLFLLLLFTVYFLLFTEAYALDVNRTVLDNGLTLLIEERHKLPVVVVNVGFKAGSLVESAEKAGLANLTAELLTAGTRKRKASEINEEVDFVGASLGASGGEDYISVNLTVLKKDLDLGFDLLSDIILNPVFPEDELDKKRKRIKASLRASEDDPGFIASREFNSAVFGRHPYGRLIMGTAGTLDKITRNDILDFHTKYYLPNNAIMSVVGDVTHQEIGKLLGKYFLNWRSKELGQPSYPEFEKLKEKNTISIDKDLTQANIILGHIGVKRNNPDYYKLSVMNYILGSGGFASRLMQNIRDEKGLVYDIYSFFSAKKYGGSFRVRFQTKNESANTAIGEVIKEIKRIRNSPVSDVELSDAKAFLTGSFPLRIDTSQRISSFLVAVEFHGLGMDYIDRYPDYINAVTKEDVLSVAEKYLDAERFVLVVVADQEKASLLTTLP